MLKKGGYPPVFKIRKLRTKFDGKTFSCVKRPLGTSLEVVVKKPSKATTTFKPDLWLSSARKTEKIVDDDNCNP